jgi:uncharacterized small protein (DUF1192 family)
MIEEVAEPRPMRGDTLRALAREDLELYGREELQERVEQLKAEIQRVEAQLQRKHDGRAAADALFSIRRE